MFSRRGQLILFMRNCYLDVRYYYYYHIIIIDGGLPLRLLGLGWGRGRDCRA